MDNNREAVWHSGRGKKGVALEKVRRRKKKKKTRQYETSREKTLSSKERMTLCERVSV